MSGGETGFRHSFQEHLQVAPQILRLMGKLLLLSPTPEPCCLGHHLGQPKVCPTCSHSCMYLIFWLVYQMGECDWRRVGHLPVPQLQGRLASALGRKIRNNQNIERNVFNCWAVTNTQYILYLVCFPHLECKLQGAGILNVLFISVSPAPNMSL